MTSHNLDEIHLMQESILLHTVLEQTKNCAFVWTYVAPTLFRTEVLSGTSLWDIRSARIGVRSGSGNEDRFELQFMKDGVEYANLKASVYPEVQDIFEILEEQFSSMGNNEEDAIRHIQGVRNCHDLQEFNIIGYGRVVVGGDSILELISNDEIGGGVVVGGSAVVGYDPFLLYGGIVVGGEGEIGGEVLTVITFTSNIDLETDALTDDWWVDVDGTEYRQDETIERLEGTSETYTFNIECNIIATGSVFQGWRLINADGTTDLGTDNPLELITPDKDSELKAVALCF